MRTYTEIKYKKPLLNDTFINHILHLPGGKTFKDIHEKLGVGIFYSRDVRQQILELLIVFITP
ncbi:MAG: hypothetical protein MJA29_07025, partial [Candidatus Omnitrophica bacterium]|nr:hypothetical protein [Candidatus Omnitrophota bacterium]